MGTLLIRETSNQKPKIQAMPSFGLSATADN